MEHGLILRKLRERLRIAALQRDEASARFDEALQLPSGIPYPDSTNRIQKASREYSAALREVVKATTALSNFLTHGVVPLEEEEPGTKT